VVEIGTPPTLKGVTKMKISDMLSSDEWGTIQKTAAAAGTDPLLIAAIGWHETHWGDLGLGKKGYYTGYGAYSGTNQDSKYAGFDNQVAGTASKMAKWGMAEGAVSKAKLEAGNAGLLSSGIYAADKNWASSVWSVYSNLSNDLGTGTSGTVESSVGTAETVPATGDYTKNWKDYLGVGAAGIIGIFALFNILK